MQSGDNESDIQVNAFQIKIYLTSYDLVGVNNFLDCHFGGAFSLGRYWHPTICHDIVFIAHSYEQVH